MPVNNIRSARFKKYSRRYSRRYTKKQTQRNKLIKKITKKNIINKTVNELYGSNKWPYLPLNIVNKLEKVAEYYNISHKARGLEKPTKSDKGFLEVYRSYKGNPKLFEHLSVRENKPDGETWAHHREDFCNRRYAMIKGKKNYGLYDTNGLPTIMHTNMLMWACSPDIKNIIKNTDNIIKKIFNITQIEKKNKNDKQ